MCPMENLELWGFLGFWGEHIFSAVKIFKPLSLFGGATSRSGRRFLNVHVSSYCRSLFLNYVKTRKLEAKRRGRHQPVDYIPTTSPKICAIPTYNRQVRINHPSVVESEFLCAILIVCGNYSLSVGLRVLIKRHSERINFVCEKLRNFSWPKSGEREICYTSSIIWMCGLSSVATTTSANSKEKPICDLHRDRCWW